MNLTLPGALPTPADTWGWSMSGRPLNFWDHTFLMADADYRRVAETLVFVDTHAVVISTFFVCSAVRHDGVFPPLFETMLFVNGHFLRGPDGVDAIFGYRPKTATLDEAYTQHYWHVDEMLRLGGRLALPTTDPEPAP